MEPIEYGLLASQYHQKACWETSDEEKQDQKNNETSEDQSFKTIKDMEKIYYDNWEIGDYKCDP